MYFSFLSFDGIPARPNKKFLPPGSTIFLCLSHECILLIETTRFLISYWSLICCYAADDISPRLYTIKNVLKYRLW